MDGSRRTWNTALAATNRADVLDTALLRPGRFDRQILVELPIAEAVKILGVHARSRPLSDEVSMELTADPGFSGADLQRSTKRRFSAAVSARSLTSKPCTTH